MESTKAKVENSLTVLLVSNLVESQAYYEKALGCEVNEHWAIRDGFGLGFKLIQAADPSDVRPNKGAWNTYAYVRTHQELDLLYEELKANGALVAAEPFVTEHDWGVWKEFSVKDPDGYVIGFGSGNKNN
ncbi:catechol 2,3-dioxygenase-like lactoylglutathione lyase family enzyme [Paenibacillus phyllosphaerae]|uniref:Catechol 2,3-dioxygenase-like lactoylglutathione lyase family enzyme n=1 Tax=Paenibacillus phyllosphaerae TaxID=274593 RepID=A0A7W5B1J5_9BACL|nr:VOC family protein [Paenibacillus phyllosphaerae]MBB3112713.1 catechol 2,3-dioxygenase-like lactoylglutathione lyase family enzyme [Paenibacillus phyllosphaerae]